jgi:hypothetical protein
VLDPKRATLKLVSILDAHDQPEAVPARIEDKATTDLIR